MSRPVPLILLLVLSLWLAACYGVRFGFMEDGQWVGACADDAGLWQCQVRATLGLLIHWRVLAWVALGAALFVLVPQTSGAESDAMSRVLQGVIAGIGFLGAGTILKNPEGDEGHVKGLTTAAGLWMTAAIGVAAGVGKEATALLSTLLALGIFSVMPRIVRLFEKDEQKTDDH